MASGGREEGKTLLIIYYTEQFKYLDVYHSRERYGGGGGWSRGEGSGPSQMILS